MARTVPVSLAVLADFVQMHDSIHNSLGLSKRATGFVLTMSALLLLKSGHALRVTHLRHHRQCLSDDDPEGEPAKWTLRQVFTNGPYHIFALRFASLRIAPATRNIQWLETAITFLLLVGFLLVYYFTGSIIPLVYWGGVFVMSCLMRCGILHSAQAGFEKPHAISGGKNGHPVDTRYFFFCISSFASRVPESSNGVIAKSREGIAGTG